ncbi:MAG: hypothetical protein ACREDO_06625 [Methyloceanibacter sp.]
MQMIRLLFTGTFALSLALLASAAFAEPKEADEEESADTTFADSFVGKTYSSDLEVEGWADYGGGLVAPPVYVRQYQREVDGTYLILTSRETAPASQGTPASFVVADALIVPKPQSGTEFSIACVQGEDPTLRFMGEAKGKEEAEWWTNVRQAWEISIETGEITEAKTKGIKCTNVSWGQ